MDVVATSSQPALGAIRMAWWRERLEELDDGGEAPAEPRLQLVRAQLVPKGVSGCDLSRLEEAWLPMLEPFPWGADVVEGFRLRGRLLFGIGARLLGGDPNEVESAGALWSLVDGAGHCSDSSSRDLLRDAARAALKDVPPKLPTATRALTVLAALAAYDLRPGARLGRVGAALAHRFWGTILHS